LLPPLLCLCQPAPPSLTIKTSLKKHCQKQQQQQQQQPAYRPTYPPAYLLSPLLPSEAALAPFPSAPPAAGCEPGASAPWRRPLRAREMMSQC
jgi:hypothetical protein